MKVPSLIRTNPVVRGLLAVSLAWALAAGGAAPLAAIAEDVPAVTTAAVSADASAAPVFSLATTLTLDPSAVATPAATPTSTPAPAKKLTVRQIVAKVGRESGLSKAEIDALLWLCKRESNFHPNSHSRSECHGLFQLSAGMAHGKPWRDPVWNTKRAIKYMRGRYGGVLKAKAFWAQHHWY